MAIIGEAVQTVNWDR